MDHNKNGRREEGKMLKPNSNCALIRYSANSVT